MHASAISAAGNPVPTDTHAVVLQVSSEDKLAKTFDALKRCLQGVVLFIEPDLPPEPGGVSPDGQATAIGLPIITALVRQQLKPVLSKLQLLR